MKFATGKLFSQRIIPIRNSLVAIAEDLCNRRVFRSLSVRLEQLRADVNSCSSHLWPASVRALPWHHIAQEYCTWFFFLLSICFNFNYYMLTDRLDKINIHLNCVTEFHCFSWGLRKEMCKLATSDPRNEESDCTPDVFRTSDKQSKTCCENRAEILIQQLTGPDKRFTL